MKREGRDVWEQRVRRLTESGLTAKEFAAELGINVHTLNAWKWKLVGGGRSPAESSGGRPKPAARFIEVVSAHSARSPGERACGAEDVSQHFELLLRDGVRVRVPARFDAGALRALVSALEAR